MSTRRWAPGAALVLVAALVLPAAPAGAAATSPTAGKAGSPVKIAVLDVRATGKVDPKAVEGLGSLIGSEASARPGVQVLTGSDIRAMIGFERERQMLGCAETSCLAEIGGALGVDYVLASEVSIVGGTWLLTLALVDISRAQPIGRLTKRADSEKQLVDLTVVGTAELLKMMPARSEPAPAVAAAPAPAPAAASAPSPAPQPAAGPAPAPAAATAPAAETTASSASGGSSTLGWVVFGAGAAAVLGGGLLYGDAWLTKSEFDASTETDLRVSRDEAEFAQDTAPIGLGVLVVGAGAMVASRLFLAGDE